MLAQRFLPKKISELRDADTRVSLVGKIVSVVDNGFEIEDDSGRKEISSGYPVKEGDMVRVFCTLVDGKPKAEAVQSLNGLDLNLYHKVQGLYRKAGI